MAKHLIDDPCKAPHLIVLGVATTLTVLKPKLIVTKGRASSVRFIVVDHEHVARMSESTLIFIAHYVLMYCCSDLVLLRYCSSKA